MHSAVTLLFEDVTLVYEKDLTWKLTSLEKENGKYSPCGTVILSPRQKDKLGSKAELPAHGPLRLLQPLAQRSQQSQRRDRPPSSCCSAAWAQGQNGSTFKRASPRRNLRRILIYSSLPIAHHSNARCTPTVKQSSGFTLAWQSHTTHPVKRKK